MSRKFEGDLIWKCPNCGFEEEFFYEDADLIGCGKCPRCGKARG